MAQLTTGNVSMAGQSNPTDIASLCRRAFDESHRDPSASRAALKSLANTLLLEESTRQRLVDLEYASNVADRLKVSGDNQDELICSRILFLLTYKTKCDFEPLFKHHGLADSVHRNIAYHALRYSGENFKEDPLDSRALSESLKLLFNLTQFYPKSVSAFNATIPHILTILFRTHLEEQPLQPPANLLINALLNLEIPGEETLSGGTTKSTPLFPASNPTCYTQRMISILESALRNNTDEGLETTVVPLVTLLRRINEIAPAAVCLQMQTQLLPSTKERDQPLGKSDTLASRLLRLSTSPVAPNLKEGVSSLLFELSDKDAATFIRNVGYGFAAGYLMTHNIPVPERTLSETGEEWLHVDGREINPITGQRRDMEPSDPRPEMTDEEKEREAERLFVLFERLRATGVVNVLNPVEQAAREGRFEEVD